MSYLYISNNLSCQRWTHIKCAGITAKEYNELQECDFDFVCSNCQFSSLPFYSEDFIDIDGDSIQTDSQDSDHVADSDFYECFKRRGLHFLHINLRSMLSKISELRLIAQNSNAAVIGVSETWLDSSVRDSEISIPNYTVFRKDRNSHGGGVCVYVRNDIAYNKRTDLMQDNLESLWIELKLPKTRPILVCVAYRPPKQQDFFSMMEECMLKCNNLMDSECYILGDFNINLLHSGNRRLQQEGQKNWCNMFDLCQLISVATRITDTTQTLLDHIYVSDKDRIAQSGVLNLGVSDHCVIFCTRKIVKGLFRRHNTTVVRSLKKYSVAEFISELNAINWDPIYSCDDVDIALEIFSRLFGEAMDKVAPERTIRIKQRSEPWINDEILQCIHDRDSFYFKFRKSKSPELYKEYCSLRNRTQRLIKSAKRDFFENQVNENRFNSKALWKSLSQLGYSQKMKQKLKIGIEIDGDICFEDSKVADEFNKFYTTVAEKLVSKLPTPRNQFDGNHVSNFYKGKGVKNDSFQLSEVSEDVVLKHLQGINPTKSTGLDKLPARFLRDSAPGISKQITFIINLSIQSNTVPANFKKAKVVPLFKKDNKFDVGNYRPVSILSTLSKVLERVVYDQTEKYLVDNNLLYEYQSGFRAKFSTDTCLIYLNDYLKQFVSNGNYVGMVLIDLRKAFDTVNHSILCDKLKSVGLSDSSVEWFRSYLDNRTQSVEVNGSMSDVCNVTCGVPQGSILGPMLFNIYVNDMCSAVGCKLLLYADDSALIVSDKSAKVVEETLSTELQKLSDWLVDNRLSLHLGKTEAILFGSRRKLRKVSSLNVICNGTKIGCTKQVKYLGAQMEQNLSGDAMAKNVLGKVNGRLKYLYRQGKYLPKNLKHTLCNALLSPIFDYACSSWYNGVSVKYKHKLQTCQNKIIRYILGLGSRDHVGPEELDKVGWLDVSHRAAQQQLHHVHNIFYSRSPGYLGLNFVRANARHNYYTRNSNFGFCVERTNSISNKTFYSNGIKLWNSLPRTLQSLESKIGFKTELKKHLISEMYRKEAQVFFYY